MVWNVEDHKRINKIEQKYEQISPFHPTIDRKISTTGGQVHPYFSNPLFIPKIESQELWIQSHTRIS